jgi:uncharacterized membrane protein
MGYILSLALFLRLIFINQSLWLDESIEALALMGRMGPLMTYALADYQPPLYHLIGWVNTQLFGYSEIALRLPSLISGLLTVVFIIKIGELVASKKVGIIAGLLAATNPLLIYYSVEGRTYAMTAFFVTASFYYFIKLLNYKSQVLGSKIYYLLFTTAFIYTSYLSWFALLAQGLYALYKKRFDLVALQFVSALTLLAWIPSFISSLSIGQSTRGSSPEWGRVVGGLEWKSLPLTWVKFNIGRLGFENKTLYAAVVSALGLFHLYILKKLDYQKYSVFFLWIVPPVLLGLLTAYFLPVYSYFRLLFVLPAYLLLLPLSSLKLSKYLVYLNLVFLVIFLFSPRYHKEDWRSLMQDLPADSVVAMPSRAQSAPLHYYGWTGEIVEPSHEELTGDKVYYVRYVEDLFDVSKLGQANFKDSGYTITSQKVYPGIQVDIYENSN